LPRGPTPAATRRFASLAAGQQRQSAFTMALSSLRSIEQRSFLKRGQCVVPESVEVGAKRLDAGGVELVQAPRACGAIDDQLRVLEDAEMLRDRRPADRKLACNLADRKGPVEEPLDNRAA